MRENLQEKKHIKSSSSRGMRCTSTIYLSILSEGHCPTLQFPATRLDPSFWNSVNVRWIIPPCDLFRLNNLKMKKKRYNESRLFSMSFGDLLDVIIVFLRVNKRNWLCNNAFNIASLPIPSSSAREWGTSFEKSTFLILI